MALINRGPLALKQSHRFTVNAIVLSGKKTGYSGVLSVYRDGGGDVPHPIGCPNEKRWLLLLLIGLFTCDGGGGCQPS